MTAPEDTEATPEDAEPSSGVSRRGILGSALWAGVGGRFSPVLALWCLSALALLGFLGYVLAVPLRRVGRTDPQAVAQARRLAGEQG